MAKVEKILSKRVNRLAKSEIMLRLSVARSVQFRLRTNIYIAPQRFRDGEVVPARVYSSDFREIKLIIQELKEMEAMLMDICQSEYPSYLTKEFMQDKIDDFHNTFHMQLVEAASHADMHRDGVPEVVNASQQAPLYSTLSAGRNKGQRLKNIKSSSNKGFFDIFLEYMRSKEVSESRKNRYQVLYRSLYRYEKLQKLRDNRSFCLTLSTFTIETAKDFEHFLKSEDEVYAVFPALYEVDPLKEQAKRKIPKPVKRGHNVVANIMSCLRSFFNYCVMKKYLTHTPFIGAVGNATERYGTPYFLSMQERDIIANYDLSEHPHLEVQRDIFIFQTLVGCRVSDLVRITPNDIINDVLEYIPQKTLHDRTATVRVPLSRRAKCIVKQYCGVDPQGRILPFISPQKYNVAIKKIFTICGITRQVTIIDPKTGKEKKQPLNVLASSHIARRTFIGNLYKKVKDPCLIGSMSGHSEGSKAFARYRQIDDDIKKEVIGYLD